MHTLANHVIMITGSSRGIGREIALKLASHGAVIIVTGKTETPHPSLPGTIHTVAEEVNLAGGIGVAKVLDVRDEQQIANVVAEVVGEFGRLDMLVNNASAISLTDTLNTPMRRFDLMMGVNARGTFACSQACIPHLARAANPHILTLSPPLSIKPKWFANHVAYTMSKYGMSMCTLGMAEEFRDTGIAINSLWPRTSIATMAIKVHFPEEIWRASRWPSIMADAAELILTTDSRQQTGQFFIDDVVLQHAGVTDLDSYAVDCTVPLFTDLFLDEDSF